MTSLTFNTGIIDTFLREANPTTAFGTATHVEVDSGTGANVQGLLAFSSIFGSGPGQIPFGSTITSASLTLQTTNGSAQGGALYRMATSWNAQSTWASLGGGVALGTEAVANPDVITGAVAAGARTFDVTASLQAWAGGDANNGWLFQAGGTDGWDFYSSEGAIKPVLTVNFTAPTAPPPTTTPILSIQDAGATEGPAAKMVFTVRLDQAAGTSGVTVNYATADISATGSTQPGVADYLAVTNGTISFASGESVKTIEIPINDDASQEQDETFRVLLSSPTGATLSPQSSATGTIRDNDASTVTHTVSFSQGANDYSGAIDTFVSQASSTTNYGSARRVEVDGGSGVELQGLLAFTNIFGSGPGQIPFGASITSANLTLQTTNASAQGARLYEMTRDWNAQATWSTLGDGVQIGSETLSTPDLATGSVAVGSRSFDVTKSLQSWAGGAPNKGWLLSAAGTDGWDFYSSEGTTKPVLTVTYTGGAGGAAPIISISPGTPNPQTEGGSIIFHVTLDRPSTETVTIRYATVDGTAKAGSDYDASVDTLTFLANDTTKDVVITLRDDTVGELQESFTVVLDSPTNAFIGSPSSATGNIRDNDGGAPPPPTTLNPSVVKVHDTSPNGAGDPSALAYVPEMNTLFLGDSEHDESPYNSQINLFAYQTDGAFMRSYSLTDFTKEPTGLAYNPFNHYLYITDDDEGRVFWIDPQASEFTLLGEFSTAAYGDDSEDPKIDPVTGNIYMLDGVALKLFELTPTGSLVRTINLPSVMEDAEALAYDSAHGVFFVGSGASAYIYEIDKNGNLLATLDVLRDYRHPETGARPVPKGFELAPSSDPNDGNQASLYVADYGIDQRLDGRLFEIDLGDGWLVT